jgi:DNA-3-methyladenine glycosylase II
VLGVTPADYQRARRLLMRRDPVLGAAIKRIGQCGMADRQRKDHLTALTGAIVSQQLSTRAAATIFGRFAALFPDSQIPHAAAIHEVSDTALRGVGFSSQKVGYLRDLCARIVDGRLVLDELDVLGDELVIERLTAVKGFGRWTAEMFLMFHEMRADVLPVDDIGVAKAIAEHYNGGKRMTPAEMREFGKRWAPWRSVATWYLWRSLDPVPIVY